jgi:RimJ/RimL family protein N-acetyltransferase
MINSDSIILAPLISDDIPILFQWINDREIVLLNAPYKPVHENAHKQWFEKIQERTDLVILGIRHKESNKLIGSCQLLNINYIHRSAELQIRIAEKSEQGLGFGTAAIHLLISHAFFDLNLNRISVQVFSTNVRALYVYEKTGFKKEGILRQAAFIDGQYIDIIVLGLIKAEYDR